MRHPVWDLPTRLFHWSLAPLVFTSWLTFELGEMTWHSYAGYALLALLLFRLAWGFCGSVHSRFSDFLKGPKAIRAYLKGSEESIGHNPLGGWSAFAMLILLLLQAVSGLFNSDGLIFDGPYYSSISSDSSDLAGALHGQLFYALLAFIALHITAVLTYEWRGSRLIKAMLSGYKTVSGGAAAVKTKKHALLVLILASVAVALLIYLAPTPDFSAYY